MALGKCTALPSIVKMWPGMLLPLPIAFSRSASAFKILPNCAWPSERGLSLIGATLRSWIIHPSYHPLSLLITKSPEISVKISMKASTSFGSVGKPGLGSRTTRTAPMVGRPQSGPVAVSMAVSFTPGIKLVKGFGSKPVVSNR